MRTQTQSVLGASGGRAVALLVGLACALSAAPVAASNQDAFLLGDEAALTGGAVVAATDDGAAAWYNPAGLATIRRASVDLSASAFTLRHYILPKILATRRLSGELEFRDVDFFDFLSVPSALTYVRPIEGTGWTLAGGLYVTQARDVYVEPVIDGVAGPLGQPGQRWSLLFAENLNEYAAGPSAGVTLTPTLRVGAGVYGVAILEETTTQLWSWARGGVPSGTPEGAFVLRKRTRTVERYGVTLHTGVQWEPAASWSLALTVRAPAWMFMENTDVRGVDAYAIDPNTGRVEHRNIEEGGLDSISRVETPGRMHVGAAWQPGDALRVSAELDVTPAFNSLTTRERRWIVNGRAGVLWSAWPGTDLGAGLFTDRSPFISTADQLGSSDVDYAGGTLGLRRHTRYALADGGHLELTTTLALRYALGLGELQGLGVDPDRPPNEASFPLVSDVIFHEYNLHLGSGVRF